MRWRLITFFQCRVLSIHERSTSHVVKTAWKTEAMNYPRIIFVLSGPHNYQANVFVNLIELYLAKVKTLHVTIIIFQTKYQKRGIQSVSIMFSRLPANVS